jgi:hypothetical protein
MSEGFPTFLAFIRFLTSMDSLMWNKGCTLAKCFSTLLTFERSFSSMNSHVNKLFEIFFTNITFKGFLFFCTTGA